jgi:F-box and WD-40 domain protein CDC4
VTKYTRHADNVRACLRVLQGHTNLVGQLQLFGDRLISGGSDGRIIIFDLTNLESREPCRHRLCAHDNSVTSLQADDRFVVSGGNDGRVKLWEVATGRFIRELTKPCDAVWRINFKEDRVVVLLQRDGKTVLEVISFRPSDMAMGFSVKSKGQQKGPLEPEDVGGAVQRVVGRF